MTRDRFERSRGALLLALCLTAFSSCKSTSSPSVSVSYGAGNEGGAAPEAPPSLIERVHDLREAQEETREHIEEVREIFLDLTTPQAIDLGRLSKDLKRASRTTKRDAERLERDLRTFEERGDDLVARWSKELDTIEDSDQRKASKKLLSETRKQSEKVLDSLKKVKKHLDPVVLSLDDYLLFFEHNLNARAIAALDDTYERFDKDVVRAKKELEEALADMEGFLEALDPDFVSPEPAPAPDPQDDPVEPDPDPPVTDPVDDPVPDPVPSVDPVTPLPDPVDPADPADTGDPVDPSSDPAAPPTNG